MPEPGRSDWLRRAAPLEILEANFERARRGEARAVLIVGGAGMGKTTLIEQFLAGASAATLIRAEGVESELDFDFGLVDQLLRQASSAAAADRARDHLRAGRALLDMLSELEAQAPVVLVLDDLHWADAASLRAVLFAVRRLVSERVLTLMSAREEALDHLPLALRSLASRARGVSVRTEPLTAEEIQGLAEASGVSLSPGVARALRDHTGGSPLYTRTLLDELPPERWSADGGTWPAPRSYSALVNRRVQAAPEGGRRLIEALSVIGLAAKLEAVAHVANADDPLEAADATLDTGLVTIHDGTIRFEHPLSRAAVYHELRPALRAQLHARAATTSATAAAAVRHRVAATLGPDDALAGELEALAAGHRSRGSWPAVSTALLSASRLSSDADDQERRLLEAAEAALYGSDPVRAQHLLAQVEALPPSALRDGVLAFAAIALGKGDEAEALLASAWERCDVERAPVLAAKLAERRAFLAVLRLQGRDIVEWGRRAVALSPDNDVTVPLSTWSLVLGLDSTGRRAEAYEVLESSSARLGPRLAGGGYPLADVRGSLLLAGDRAAEAREQLKLAAPLMVGHGLLTPGSLTYSRLARSEYLLGEWDEAAVHAELAIAVADEAMDAAARTRALHSAVLPAAARGLRDDVAGLRDALEEIDSPFEAHLAARSVALACCSAATGRPAQVRAELERVVTEPWAGDTDDPGYWPWHDLYVDALLDLGAIEAAERFLSVWEPFVRSMERWSMGARLARARGRLAWLRRDPEASFRAFDEALDAITPLAMPYEQARIALEYGQVLRRDGQRRAATTRLYAAKATFDALGAVPLLERCDEELEACGVALTRRDRAISRDELTPRERAVARLAAAGKSNREIAAELMLSVKTVENHLTRVFAKRGVSSRSELEAV